MKFTLISLVLLATTTVGCTPSAEPSARSLDDSYRIDLIPGTEASSPPRGEAIIVYFIQDSKIVARPRVAPNFPTLREVLFILTAGPTERELDLGVRTVIGETILDFDQVVRDGRTITIEISEDFGELPGAEQTLLVAQLVLTFAENFSIDRVLFLRDGELTPVLGPSGEVLERAVTAADFRSLLLLN